MPPRSSLGNVTGSPELTDMATSYFSSCVLSAAARLGIADALGDTERSAEEVAAACGADASSMRRLLRTMAAQGLLQETTPDRFQLTGKGRPLRRDVPGSAWPSVIFWADLLADFWTQLGECVRTGKTAQQVMEAAGRSSRWSQDPNANAMFRAVMGTAENYAPIAGAVAFPASGVIADLGGGGGALIRAVLERHPQARGMLVDREASIEAARTRFQGSPVADRCTLLTADVCEGVPPGADVYMLKHVLHGYTDERALEILHHTRAALPAGGRVLIIEFVLPDAVSQPAPELVGRFMSDLNMMAVTGGRERSEREWRRLLEQSGLSLMRTVAVPELDVSILEAQAGA